MSLDLSIVIVNYNTGSVIRSCLNSVIQQTKNLSHEIFVVDNASTDGSVEMIRKEFPHVHLMPQSENLYFTKACNVALSRAQGRYLMILNPDTFIQENAFKTLTDFMDQHPDVGACGPKFLNVDGTLQGIGHRYPTLIYALFELLFINAIFPNNFVRRRRVYADLDESRTQEIQATGGSCMMVRKEVAAKEGFLDEGFLMYWEETDWCRRIRQAGWKIYGVIEARVYHHGAKATEQVPSKKIQKIFLNSMCYYYRKYYGFVAFILIGLLAWIHFSVLQFYRGVKKR